MKKLLSLTILALIVPGLCLGATSSTVRVSVTIPELPAHIQSRAAATEEATATTESTPIVTTREVREGTIVLVQTIVDR